MASVNRVILVGRLGHRPVLRSTLQGTSQCRISIATNMTFTDRAANTKVPATQWHNLYFVNTLAEMLAERCIKGSEICAEGWLQTRKYMGRGDVEKTITEVVVQKLEPTAHPMHAGEGA